MFAKHLLCQDMLQPWGIQWGMGQSRVPALMGPMSRSGWEDKELSHQPQQVRDPVCRCILFFFFSIGLSCVASLRRWPWSRDQDDDIRGSERRVCETERTEVWVTRWRSVTSRPLWLEPGWVGKCDRTWDWRARRSRIMAALTGQRGESGFHLSDVGSLWREGGVNVTLFMVAVWLQSGQ